MGEGIFKSIPGGKGGNKIGISSNINVYPTTKEVESSHSESVYYMLEKRDEVNFNPVSRILYV